MKKIHAILAMLILTSVSISCNKDDDDNKISCNVSDLEVMVGDCTSIETYDLVLNFNYENVTEDTFDVTVGDDQLFGTYAYADLPVTLHDFQISGNDVDFLYVCTKGEDACCERVQFYPPDCLGEADCSIENLSVEVGECASPTTYDLTVDFDYSFEFSSTSFSVYDTQDNRFFGTYQLADLPVTLNDYKISGNNTDYIKVCINNQNSCCVEQSFAPPACE